MKELIEVKSDCFNIVKRLKKLNKNYEVYYNLKSKKFILYLNENTLNPMVYCLTFPFEYLDERAVEYVLKSEVQNRKKLLEEIERQNELLLKKEQKKLSQKMENEYERKRCS